MTQASVRRSVGPAAAVTRPKPLALYDAGMPLEALCALAGIGERDLAQLVDARIRRGQIRKLVADLAEAKRIR